MPKLPVLSVAKTVKIFKHFGWKIARKKGSHIILENYEEYHLGRAYADKVVYRVITRLRVRGTRMSMAMMETIKRGRRNLNASTKFLTKRMKTTAIIKYTICSSIT